MRRLALYGGSLILVLAPLAACQDQKPTGAVTKAAGDKVAAEAAAVAEEVAPEAAAALKRMSDYLSKLNSFELTSDTTLDVVSVNNQRLQLDGKVHYKVKRPGIWIDLASDLKSRRYFYNGKEFTIFAPKLGFYATAPAPPTNREFLKAVYDQYGIELPLEDLFRWNDGDDSDLKALRSGYNVGTATLDGVVTDHWAFRQGDFDWEVWIDQGDKPLPRKLSIIDRTQPTQPGYTARLKWVLNPSLPDSDFTFTPGQGATKIRIASLVGEPK